MKRKRKPGPTPMCDVPADTLRELRVKSGLKQKQLAIRMGLGHVGTKKIGHWENCRGEPDGEDQAKMVRVFYNCGISPEDLLESGFGKALLKRAGIINEAKAAGEAKWEDFKAEAVPNIWSHELEDFKSSFWATNYLRQEFFAQKIAEMGLRYQKEKRNAAAGISKILIADDENELKELYEEMKKQDAAELAPKWILREWIECGDLKKIYDGVYDGLGFTTFDFQIFDGSRILFWLLEERTRKPTGGKRLCGGSNCQDFVEFYQQLFKAAEWFDPRKEPSQFKAAIERRREEGEVCSARKGKKCTSAT